MLADISRYIDAVIAEGHVEAPETHDPEADLLALGMSKEDIDHFCKEHARKLFATACTLGYPVKASTGDSIVDLLRTVLGDGKPDGVTLLPSDLSALCFAMVCYGIDAERRRASGAPIKPTVKEEATG